MSTNGLSASVRSLGVIGPGFGSWPEARAVLAGDTPWVPAPTRVPNPDMLPPAERRRVGAVVKLALCAGAEAVHAAGADASQLATVFASAGGDGANCHAICEALAGDDRRISPTRFHNSVNNAAAGYWGIATGAMATSTIVSAYDGSLAAGLIEALALAHALESPVLLVVYDHPYPEPLAAARRVSDAFAMALLLDPAANAGPRVQLGGFCDAAADLMADPAMEAVRSSIPAARGLPLLELLARDRSGTVVLDYLDDLRLDVSLSA
ncbi:beta-ketoacyl synthase chain length factor [Azoarcus sp. L1K30]|uniref:beta-ketoacyl synthase chain length factor n=1 Tax=Azoarcus sp. L1K30 TaxID=2820277 RepID=UPI001B8137A1|nr:beta-ketoacyl synthase chain length factor [Azoarcus sp. L1K30]MBR0567191.1 beta-ketoacyl synthase chain length factor [Azoarcus sp. L1K30]